MEDFADRLLQIILDESEEAIIRERLHCYNNDIEKTFISPSTIAVATTKEVHTRVEDAAKTLHEKLLTVVTYHPPSLYIRGQSYDADVDAGGWGNGIDMVANAKSEGEEMASNVAMIVARAILLQNNVVACDSKSKDNCGSSRQECNARENRDNTKKNALILVTEILRASKNLIRWYRFQLSTSSQTHAKYSTSSSAAVDRLCSVGMIRLYAVLIEFNSYKKGENIDVVSERGASYSIVWEALARNASVTLFHATYGPAAKKSRIVQKGLSYLVEPSSDFNWISILSCLLMSSHSVPVMLSLFRNVHNLVWSAPTITSKLNKAFEEYDKPSIDTAVNILSVLVSLLAWTLRSKPDFPGNKNFDRRSELATEILRVLFAIRSNSALITKKLEESNPDIMTQLGILLVDILHLPNKDRRTYECKLAVLTLLMDPPQTYCHFLVVNKAIDPLLTILWLQLNDVLIVNGGSVRGENNITSILPVLVVLNKLSQFHITIKSHVKEYIFPPTAEAGPNDTSDLQKSENDKIIASPSGKNMKPINAPPGTVRWKLIRLMTSIDSNVKRCASELLWTLCDGDSKEYVTRTGFGNAVHMLGIKGIVQIPE